MSVAMPVWEDPVDFLSLKRPDHPVHFFCPSILRATAEHFLDGFPGQVTYAVKANPAPAVISNLAATGISAFDVASPDEMALVCEHAPGTAMHYHNPVRSQGELEKARNIGVKTYAIDCAGEFDKLAGLIPPKGVELSVRFKLPLNGASYDFGSKFGATPETAVTLLKEVAAKGYAPSLTFHPGTQCHEPEAWTDYIFKAADIAREADVTLHRLNVGGGFPSHRNGPAPDLGRFFETIRSAVRAAFKTPPELVCEPGRSMVAESFALAVRIKSFNDEGDVFLNDGKYGGLADFADMDVSGRFVVLSPDGAVRTGEPVRRRLFGPTCDSLDVMPGKTELPADAQAEDYLLFAGMGAYSSGMTTRFNGYGQLEMVLVENQAATPV